jgi:hypothetical protein
MPPGIRKTRALSATAWSPFSRCNAPLQLVHGIFVVVVPDPARLVDDIARDRPTRRQRNRLGQNECRLADAAWRQTRPQLDFIELCGVGESVCHTVPDLARNFYNFSALPGHERNLLRPDFAAHGGDGVAEGELGFWIPGGGSRREGMM